MSNTGLRRLAIYVVLDWSGSMQGAGQTEALTALRWIVDHVCELAQEDTKHQTPLLLTFLIAQMQTWQLLPLTPVGRLQLKESPTDLEQIATIETGGPCLLVPALSVLQGSLQHEMVSPGHREGDASPVVFVLTDGHPADDPMELAKSLLALGKRTLLCVALTNDDAQLTERWRYSVLRDRIRIHPNQTQLFRAAEKQSLCGIISNEVLALAGNQRWIPRPDGYVAKAELVPF